MESETRCLCWYILVWNNRFVFPSAEQCGHILFPHRHQVNISVKKIFLFLNWTRSIRVYVNFSWPTESLSRLETIKKLHYKNAGDPSLTISPWKSSPQSKFKKWIVLQQVPVPVIKTYFQYRTGTNQFQMLSECVSVNVRYLESQSKK